MFEGVPHMSWLSRVAARLLRHKQASARTTHNLDSELGSDWDAFKKEYAYAVRGSRHLERRWREYLEGYPEDMRQWTD